MPTAEPLMLVYFYHVGSLKDYLTSFFSAKQITNSKELFPITSVSAHGLLLWILKDKKCALGFFSHELAPHSRSPGGFSRHRALLGPPHPRSSFSWVQHLGVLPTKNFHTCQNCVYSDHHSHWPCQNAECLLLRHFLWLCLCPKAQI